MAYKKRVWWNMSNLESKPDTVASRLKIARTLMMLSQQDFAGKLSVHKNTISKWERGLAEPDLSSISLLCGSMGLSPYWLISGEGPMLDKDRDVTLEAKPGMKAGDLRGHKPSEVRGGPELDATMAHLQARLIQLEQERDEARAALMKAQDNTLKAKDETLEILRAAVVAKTKELKDMP